MRPAFGQGVKGLFGAFGLLPIAAPSQPEDAQIFPQTRQVAILLFRRGKWKYTSI